MSYQSALTAAGATVIDTKYTGSYQGTWGTIVEYKGKRGLVIGSYGSCSYCDAFQSEFDRYGSDEIQFNEDGSYTSDWGDEIRTKEEYDAQQIDYQKRLSDFGERYLHVIADKFDIQNRIDKFKKADDEDDWYDSEDRELFEWAIKFFD